MALRRAGRQIAFQIGSNKLAGDFPGQFGVQIVVVVVVVAIIIIAVGSETSGLADGVDVDVRFECAWLLVVACERGGDSLRVDISMLIKA